MYTTVNFLMMSIEMDSDYVSHAECEKNTAKRDPIDYDFFMQMKNNF